MLIQKYLKKILPNYVKSLPSELLQQTEVVAYVAHLQLTLVLANTVYSHKTE